MASEESQALKCQVIASLPSTTPVVGYEIAPFVGTRSLESPPSQAHQHTLLFSWFREQISCSIHHHKNSRLQCIACVALKIPIKESYHCSTECFKQEWKKHLAQHCSAAKAVSKSSNGNFQTIESMVEQQGNMVEQQGKAWIKVGSSKDYVPSMDDLGCRLRLESVAVECLTGIPLSNINVIETDTVITAPELHPRCMIHMGLMEKSKDLNFELQNFNARSFSVLSYNILSDLYANVEMHHRCPSWALLWQYRSKNLLHEIIGYNADILCLQELQSNHFENFFRPELEKHGYSVIFKKKRKEVYAANQYISDGCATFFRHDRFKEIMTYELEFENLAQTVVETLEPGRRNEGSMRLMKDNIALVVVLETLGSGVSHDTFDCRICVANTHIHANTNLRDVKFFQVASLINGLENIAQSQIPLLICGDLNCPPRSEPHRFIVEGGIDALRKRKKRDPLGVYQHLKLRHSIPLVSAYSCLLDSALVEEKQKRKMNPRTREPLFTNLTGGTPRVLDYIFFSGDNLEVEGLLELLDKETVGSSLPSPLWPSDHIALMARFRIKPDFSPGFCSLPPNPWKHM